MLVYGFSGDHPDLEPQILALHNLVFIRDKKESFKELCGCYDDAFWFIELLDDKVVGMVTLGYCEKKASWHIYNVCVHPEYRNKRVMRSLERSVKQYVREYRRGRREQRIFGLVHKRNRVAAKIFKKMGGKYNEGDKYNEWFMFL
jgi:ribosomal protein S18 acetylase RimI-like enzyme